jgi:hypothetical protein
MTPVSARIGEIAACPQVGDEFTNRFGERIVVSEVKGDTITVKVHRKPETAYWDIECWQQEVRAAAILAQTTPQEKCAKHDQWFVRAACGEWFCESCEGENHG